MLHGFDSGTDYAEMRVRHGECHIEAIFAEWRGLMFESIVISTRTTWHDDTNAGQGPAIGGVTRDGVQSGL